MKNHQVMRHGQPVPYWRFRNIVSIGQITIVVLLIVGAVLWAVTDGNGQRFWESYFSFAQGISDFANTSMKMPWE